MRYHQDYITDKKYICSFLLKDLDLKEYVDRFPKHIETYEKQALHFLIQNIHKHHQDILNDIELYHVTDTKIDSIHVEAVNILCDNNSNNTGSQTHLIGSNYTDTINMCIEF